jgi:endonuclease/exonuclease/phosphatase family metal-dependent hydrolase
MILSKWKCLFHEWNYEVSLMGRTLLVAEPIGGINGNRVLVGTSHFESLDSQKVRKSQMEFAFEKLQVSENIILCGDFNFDNSSEAEANVYKD